ncbi:MAG: hypothetical protein NWF06_07875 [Candidatus Bathyarchaeota archaeon]|nr:hypothetical protein [Candidatus Bathyarchaeum sp.]
MRQILHSFIAFLRSSKKTILMILTVTILSILLTSAFSALLNNLSNLSISSLGTITTVGVEAYWDPECENKTEAINWGTICPGSSNSFILYIKSFSNVKTTLDLLISNFEPLELSEYMTLSWDYNEIQLDPGQVIQVTLFLSTSADSSLVYYLINSNVNSFSIVIHIVAAA